VTRTRTAAGGGPAALGALSEDELRSRLHSCCAAEAWVEAIVRGRPYADTAELFAASDRATAALDSGGLAQALAGHPRIGETPAAHGADRRAAAWSHTEQAGVADADAELRAELAAANAEYERRFGQVYLVCASGRSAAELLDLCRSRLANDPETERGVVLSELEKINRLRLAKLLESER